MSFYIKTLVLPLLVQSKPANRVAGGFSPPAPTPPFYYPQVQMILSSGLFLEQLDVCLNELLDDFSHPRMVGDHLSYPGQLVSRHVHDSRLLLVILIRQAICPAR